MSALVEYCIKHSDVDDYDELFKLIENEFTGSPFSISLDTDELKKLDEPFTDLDKIYIVDSRINSDTNYYYSSTPVATMKILQSNNKVIVKKIDGKPITLRQILTTMIKHRHYNKKIVRADFHTFLEGFDPTNDPNVFETSFGS